MPNIEPGEVAARHRVDELPVLREHHREVTAVQLGIPARRGFSADIAELLQSKNSGDLGAACHERQRRDTAARHEDAGCKLVRLRFHAVTFVGASATRAQVLLAA